MGTRRVSVTQCDSCRKVKSTASWRITTGGTTRTCDLCRECELPIRKVLAAVAGGYELYKPADASTIEEARKRRQNLAG